MASSAPRGTARSSLTTSRPPERLRAATVAGSPPAKRRAPGTKSASFSLGRSTTKDPSNPCGRPTLPIATSSFNDLEQHAPVRARAARPGDRAQGTGDPAAAADHAAEIVRSDAQAQDEGAV